MSLRSSRMKTHMPGLIGSKILDESRTEIGKRAEKYICENIPCQTDKCHGGKWINLNKIFHENYEGVDLQCSKCKKYVQSKAHYWNSKDGSKFPLTRLSDGSWDSIRIPSTNTLRETIQEYRNNIFYYIVTYERINGIKRVNWVGVTEPLMMKNIDINRENSIVAYHMKWINEKNKYIL